jgi:UPF0271 protein
MEGTIALAVSYGAGIGAHPGYRDPENFGRASMKITAADITRLVYDQIRTLGMIARKYHADLVHVKPHGALYHDAGHDPLIAAAIADGAAQWSKGLILVGLAGSRMLEIWKKKGFRVAGEAFADRVYENDGSLRPRQFGDAVITDPDVAAQQALKIVKEGTVLTSAGTPIGVEATTICLHGDNPCAIALAKAIRQKLLEAGITLLGMRDHPINS